MQNHNVHGSNAIEASSLPNDDVSARCATEKIERPSLKLTAAGRRPRFLFDPRSIMLLRPRVMMAVSQRQVRSHALIPSLACHHQGGRALDKQRGFASPVQFLARSAERSSGKVKGGCFSNALLGQNRRKEFGASKGGLLPQCISRPEPQKEAQGKQRGCASPFYFWARTAERSSRKANAVCFPNALLGRTAERSSGKAKGVCFPSARLGQNRSKELKESKGGLLPQCISGPEP